MHPYSCRYRIPKVSLVKTHASDNPREPWCVLLATTMHSLITLPEEDITARPKSQKWTRMISSWPPCLLSTELPAPKPSGMSIGAAAGCGSASAVLAAASLSRETWLTRHKELQATLKHKTATNPKGLFLVEVLWDAVSDRWWDVQCLVHVVVSFVGPSGVTSGLTPNLTEARHRREWADS